MKRYRLAVWLFCVGVIVFAGAAVLGSCFAHRLLPGFGLEVAKSLLALGTGLILGGALKALLDLYQESGKEQKEAHELSERLLGDLRDVYNRTEQARLTIKAHQSASAYGEQMQILIGCEAALLKFKRSLELRLAGKARQAVDPDGECLLDVIGYLRALQKEYTDNYKDVEECQRYDLAVNQLRISELTAGDKPFDASQIGTSGRTWSLLQRPEQFPVLRNLIGCGEQYNERFAKPLYELAAQVLVATGRESNLDTGFDVAEFDRRVEARAGKITEKAAEERADGLQPR
jgi:hypothetical protein